jgi:hypothetical protein
LTPLNSSAVRVAIVGFVGIFDIAYSVFFPSVIPTGTYNPFLSFLNRYAIP